MDAVPRLRLADAPPIVTLLLLAVMTIEQRLILEEGLLSALSSAPSRNLELVLIMLAAVLLGPRRLPPAALSLLLVLLGLLLLLARAHTSAGIPIGPVIGTAAALVVAATAARRGRVELDAVVLALLGSLLAVSLLVYFLDVGNLAPSSRLLPQGFLELGRARGVFPWASDLGAAAGMTILLAMEGRRRGTLLRPWGWLAIALGVLAILVADALTAAVAVVAATTVATFYPRSVERSGRLWRRLPTVLAVSWALAFIFFPWVVGAVGSPTLLTGRGLLWARIVDVVSFDRLLTGYGYRPLDPGTALYTSVGVPWAFHGHNVGVEVALTVGVLGVLLVAGFIAIVVRRGCSAPPEDGGWILAHAMFITLVWSTDDPLTRFDSAHLLALVALYIVLTSRMFDAGPPRHPLEARQEDC